MKKSFTLIELLVVIAIIGLLASVVMITVGGVRKKANNAKRLSDIIAYRDAIEMYKAKSDKGKYFYPGTNSFVCLGDYADDKCWSRNNFSESAKLKDALRPYLTRQPAGDVVCQPSFPRFEGYIYRIPRQSPDSAEIAWFMEGVGQNCGPGKIILKNFLNLGCTYCKLILK